MKLFEPIIFPEDEIFSKYFNKYADTIFIAFNPFFKIKNLNKSNYLSSLKVNSETKSENKILNYIINSIGLNDKNIYFQNPEYPQSDEIKEKAEIINLEYIKRECNFNSYAQISMALRTSIGALKKEYARPDLCEKLTLFCDNNEIWMPNEGIFNDLVEVEIKRILKFNKYKKVILQDEFGYEQKEVLVDELEKNIDSSIKNIYTKNKEIIFSIHWDSFYFLFCSKKEIIEKSLGWFEGFYCDDKTNFRWEIEELKTSF